MTSPSHPASGFWKCAISIVTLCCAAWAEEAKQVTTRIAPDFLNQAVGEDRTLHLTLPDGRRIIGKIDQIERFSEGVAKITGTIQHPESGTFSFERQHHNGQPGALSGSLKFDSKPTEWKIQTGAQTSDYEWAETPAEDAFRPRSMIMPTTANARPQTGISREQAEDSLRKDLKIEKSADGKLRLGAVILDSKNRSIRFPASVNMTSGTVEYALVTTTGKVHEALFATEAAPRDIHVAMLLLGTKPAALSPSADQSLIVPETAAINISVDWDLDGTHITLPLRQLITFASATADKMTTAPPSERAWLYNGSRFNAAGFGAMLDGSVISLVVDEMALINNPQLDRDNDDIHLPKTSSLPPPHTPVFITFQLLSPLKPNSDGK